jgi:hypothetical protein
VDAAPARALRGLKGAQPGVERHGPCGHGTTVGLVT